METATLPPTMIVSEVLEKNNYERWSILMKHYLMAQDVWDVVKSNPTAEERNMRLWIKKNALALHAIKISCGATAFNRIKNMDSAKDAWKALLDIPKLPVFQDMTELREVSSLAIAEPHQMTELHEVVSSDIAEPHQTEQQRTLSKFIRNGDKRRLQKFFSNNSNARSDKGILEFALRDAIAAGQGDIARFLYRVTPPAFLEGNFGFILLEECITKKMFEIAYNLLHHFPKMATDKPPLGSMPIISTLAKTPPPFFRGSQLKFLKLWTYNCIIVEAGLIQRIGPGDDVGSSGGDSGCPVSLQLLMGCVMLSASMSILVLASHAGLQVLRLLVTFLSKFLAKKIYDQKSTDVYAGEVVNCLCQQLSTLDHNQFVQNGGVEATFQAIKNGIPDIAIELVRAKANILWSTTDAEDSKTMFACAIAHRQEKVARFLYECDANLVYTADEDGNNVLPLAAKLAPDFQLHQISGAALNLQNELRWFKSVKAIVPWFYNEQKNKDGETPTQVFVKEHKYLLKEAEEWIKKTAEASTVVGALIITIMFAAAFTVPGGNNQNTGFPIFLNTTETAESFIVASFKVFIVSDAISLFTASSSVLMFLGILTSRYAYEDFRMSMPIKLIIGLSSLFISIATLTVAFCATLYVMLQGLSKEVIPIMVLAGIHITCFVLLQFPLLIEIIDLTLRRGIFERKTIIVVLVEWLEDKIPIIPSLVEVVTLGLVSLVEAMTTGLIQLIETGRNRWS